MTSRYVEIRPDNIPANGKISFKNGFPVLSFTVSAQAGLLDPRTIRIVGDFAAYKDNLAAPTPLTDTDNVTMNSRLGIYNVIESLTIRAQRSKMICENIRHYSKYMNSYLALTSSLQDQLGHLSQTCLIQPNPVTFRKSVMESPTTDAVQTNSFSFHVPCGFIQSGNMIDLRPDAFGGVQLEFLLQPDSNVLFSAAGDSAGIGDAHYELSDLKLTCEVQDLDDSVAPASEGTYDFNTITSLYTSINSTNAQLQYSLALRNVVSAFMTFMPVNNINTITNDGQATTYPSGDGVSDTALARIKRVQFLKGGVKYPADFDFVANTEEIGNSATLLPDPQIIKGLVDAITPDYGHSSRVSVGPVNMTRDYSMVPSVTSETSYMNVAEGGAVMGLGVRYGLGGGEDFSTEQFGVSIESELKSDRPNGVYIFIKAQSRLIFNRNGVQLEQ
tara:strand:- start:1425 stop:2756 length:1332 start_codon:yes stop_codon:yes gene_type:complete